MRIDLKTDYDSEKKKEPVFICIQVLSLYLVQHPYVSVGRGHEDTGKAPQDIACVKIPNDDFVPVIRVFIPCFEIQLVSVAELEGFRKSMAYVFCMGKRISNVLSCPSRTSIKGESFNCKL